MVTNPDILLSIINTKLRDQYASLEDLCEDMDYSREDIDAILNPKGYYYDSGVNQYKQKN